MVPLFTMDLFNMFTMDLFNMFIMDLFNMFTMDLFNLFIMDLFNLFIMDLFNLFIMDLFNMFYELPINGGVERTQLTLVILFLLHFENGVAPHSLKVKHKLPQPGVQLPS